MAQQVWVTRLAHKLSTYTQFKYRCLVGDKKIEEYFIMQEQTVQALIKQASDQDVTYCGFLLELSTLGLTITHCGINPAFCLSTPERWNFLQTRRISLPQEG